MNAKQNNWAILAGIFLFATWGLYLIVNEIPHEWDGFSRVAIALNTSLFFMFIFVFPVILCIGWIMGFPRWSYPYAGHTIVFSLYISNASTPGFEPFGYEMFGREPWGWRAWIPFLVVVLIALAVTRSVKPIGKFFTNIWDDWTLLTFSSFGFMPLLVAIGFDEVDRLFSLYFMVILTLAMAGTVWFYLRAGTQRGRVTALLAGIGLTTAVTIVAPTLYWQRGEGVNPTGMAIMGGVVMVFMFWPALIGLVHYLVNIRRKPDVMV